MKIVFEATAYLAKLSRETKTPMKDLEDFWKKAVGIVQKQYGASLEKEDRNKFYALVTKIFKNVLKGALTKRKGTKNLSFYEDYLLTEAKAKYKAKGGISRKKSSVKSGAKKTTTMAQSPSVTVPRDRQLQNWARQFNIPFKTVEEIYYDLVDWITDEYGSITIPANNALLDDMMKAELEGYIKKSKKESLREHILGGL